MTKMFDEIPPCVECGGEALPWVFRHTGAGAREVEPLQMLIKCTACGMSTRPVLIDRPQDIQAAQIVTLELWRCCDDLDQTDWIRLAQMTDDEIETAADADRAEHGL